MEQILDSLSKLDLSKIVQAVLVLVICLSVSRVICRIARNALRKINTIDASLHTILNTTLKCVLYFISIVAAAGTLGIPVTSFVALFSVVGLAVSLSVQGVLTNLAGGVIILVSKPFTLNDFIECDAIMGTVKDIGILHTQLLSPDGKNIFVPNNLLQSSRLINYTSAGTRRIELQVSISYENTPDEVRAAVMEAIEAIPHVLTDPAPMVLLEKYGPHGILYNIWLFVPASEFIASKYALNESLYNVFAKNGVKITRPQLNVHTN